MLMSRIVAVSTCGLALATSALAQPPQTPQRHAGRSRLLSKSIQSGIQAENPKGHVRRMLHLATGGLLALAAPRGAGGTFKPLRRDKALDPWDQVESC